VALARRAVALDGADAEARSHLCYALYRCGDYEGALAEAERALATTPNLAHAHHMRGATLIFSGRLKEGLAALERSVRLDFLYRRPDCASGAEARCGPNNSAMPMKTAPASARRFGIDGPPRGFCYSERITFQLRTSCSPPPALLTTGLPSVKYASSIASAHPTAIAFSRSASKSGRGA
jgi:tetratricopeptide (TPR) repeat protein